jgi:hypothetical protein
MLPDISCTVAILPQVLLSPLPSPRHVPISVAWNPETFSQGCICSRYSGRSSEEMFQSRPEAESPVASCDRGIPDLEYTKDTTKQNGGRLERAPGRLKNRHGCVGRGCGA